MPRPLFALVHIENLSLAECEEPLGGEKRSG
jgi:hypothetical protein